MLDLGFRGQFGFASDFLKEIENKKYLRSLKMYSIRGNEYEERLYEVSTIKMGAMSFSQPIIHEQSLTFHDDATLLKDDSSISVPEVGKIGWELFGNTNVFFDLGKQIIAFCDSLETLKEHGYSQATFLKTPLLLRRGLIEIEITTPRGPLRCMLDSGSTWNIFNTDLADNQSIEEAALDLNNIVTLTSLQLHENKLEDITFHCLPVKLPVHIEAILGMEFFDKNLVFVDFSENYAYLSHQSN